ncbi:uncharacterized protein M421DRAFT_324712 [Didymella exigua CBS 183.55]|uniref:BTB domain-containing protein n=1 Tax=Didymella exigua CBS 183.55 TaxID=1150837 RepID=A0A6A5R739_9PLEO|nr:uncharacterized protein M421DRAFT_324712 [Didymella exigua CBS 183.55]KAF1923433.1 hypothetical protein M421DRAFT_324712 [Didymella exigua CBS 183.55]
MATTSQEQTLASFKGFLTSGAYSDLIVTCGGDTYEVHKVIVCGRAEFFARAMKFGGQEAQTGTINLPDNETEIIKLLMHYLYGGEYIPTLPVDGVKDTVSTPLRTRSENDPSSGQRYTYDFPHRCYYNGNHCEAPYICPHHICQWSGGSGSGKTSCNYGCTMFTCKECNTPALPQLNGTAEQLLVHAKMYEIGDKYEVAGLKDLAKEKFSRACKHFWNTPDFAVAADHAFSTTVEDDTGLRAIVSATISDHIELVNDPAVSVLMTQFNGLALDILQAKVKEYGWAN